MAIDSESAFLELIHRHFPNQGAGISLGRGDDAAIMDMKGQVCISSDLFLEHSHFRRSYFTPENIGHKALAVNLSDMAAMGAVPVGFNLELMIPKGVDHDYWDRLLSGMSALARKHDVVLTGGDLSRAPLLGMGVTIWGRTNNSGRFLTRESVNPGDALFVCGQIGLARIGLNALEKNGRDALSQYPESCMAHLRPEPMILEGLMLASTPQVLGLMDISDGLARDIPRFIGEHSSLGAKIIIDSKELHQELLDCCAEGGEDPIMAAFLGGEDYSLLGAVTLEGIDTLLSTVPNCRIIGEITKSGQVSLNGNKFSGKGFDHFS